MTVRSWLTSAGLAAFLVAGSAWAGGGPPIGRVAPEDLGDGAPPRTPHEGFANPPDNTRPLHPVRGPFFGLRVNSMDFEAQGRTLAWFDYECGGIFPGEAVQRYQLVRTAWRGPILRNALCDEVLGLPLPPGANVTYEGRMVTTRWIRDVGPNGRTPVGAFLGELRVAARPAALETDRPPLPLFAFRVIGTTGLRPGRGDPDEPLAAHAARCDAPLHDEGFYQGSIDKRGLREVLLAIGAEDRIPDFARILASAQIVGTFEGQLHLDPTVTEPFRYRALDRGVWWFDGVLGWRCPQARVVAHGPEPVR